MLLQHHDYIVAIKCITKKNLAKSQNLLSKEIKILQVELSQLIGVGRDFICKEVTCLSLFCVIVQ